MIVKEITPTDYGMMFLSVDLFLENIQEKGIRGAKFLTYFNKNMDTYFEFILKGIITPFNKIVCCDTPVYIETTECDYHLPTGYEVIFRYDDFCINVGKSNLLSLFSFSNMDDKSLIKKGITNKNYFTVDNCEYWEAIDFEIASGQWFFSIYGLRKKELSDEEKRYDQGYAYGFHFYRSNDLSNNNLEKCDDDKYDFSLSCDRRLEL
ncbi:hypothetical protein C4N15_05575 [Fusobacterium necrophorum subsp. funduliforme]|uniref:hypothetical protein n=1 Tax=Fusobacterium necrophorum TaxID=859 RepID=UPI000D12BA16|nr:hypothetical protein [Fusobacterium necrophorum]AVQ21137.1 hypothetical protein C4N15_05575 [Fusobacterium necrophorum subsp. funduliforme]